MIYGYIRVSTDKQDTANQKFEIERFAKTNNIIVEKWVEETISSKADLKKRLLGALLTKMIKGDMMIASEISRLGRNLMQIMSILHGCLSKEVQVWTIKDNYRLGNDIQSKVLAFAFGLSAEIERNLISQRTKEALARKKSEGARLGRPIGAANSKKKLLVHHEKIKQLIGEGMSYSKIARKIKCHRLTLSTYCNSAGISREPRKYNAPKNNHLKKIIDLTEAEELYKGGMSVSQLAKHYKVSHTILTTKMKETGVFEKIREVNQEARLLHPRKHHRA